MNQIVLFVVFILFGVFIYYILKEQCKCDIVEGQLIRNIANEGINFIGAGRASDLVHAGRSIGVAGGHVHDFVTDAHARQRELQRWEDSLGSECQEAVPDGMEEMCKIAAHYVNPNNSCAQVLLQPVGLFMTSLACLEDLGEFNAFETGEDNPLPEIFRAAKEKDNINPEFLAHGITETSGHLNNSLKKGYDHSDGICVKNINSENFNVDQKKACINIIASLSHEKNKQTPNTDKINTLTTECNRFDTCKKIFILPGPDGNLNCADLDENLRRLNCTNDNYEAEQAGINVAMGTTQAGINAVMNQLQNAGETGTETR